MIRKRITDESERLGLEIPQAVWSELDEGERDVRRRQTILEITPSGGEVTTEGTIFTMNAQVNFLKRFNFEDTPIARGLLGRLTKEPYSEISMRTSMDSETGFINQFTFFATTKLCQLLGLRPGAFIGCVLRMVEIPTKIPVWVANDLVKLA